MIRHHLGAHARRAGVTLGLALALTSLAGCAGLTSQAEPTATIPAQAQPTQTLGDPPTPTPGPFVCAQPGGAITRYAFVGADGQLTVVNGCSAAEIRGRGGRLLGPQGFSFDGKWLLATEGLRDPEAAPGVNLCDVLINTDTLAQTVTPMCDHFVSDPTRGWFGFIGWTNNTTYYDAGWGIGNDTSVQVYRVSVPSMAFTKVATFAWVGNLANWDNPSGIALRGGALYYAGYASSGDHSHAWLRRYSLATGQNTPIVALGIAGYGGCQVQVDNTPCAWAGPWDISPSGTQIAYHNPGPTQSRSDTDTEKGTPLYLAGSDAMGPTRLFPSEVPGFMTPDFSPDGRYITERDAAAVAFERLADGKIFAAPDKYRAPEWTSVPGYVILYDQSQTSDYYEHPVLYNVESGTKTTLQVGSYHFVWGAAA